MRLTTEMIALYTSDRKSEAIAMILKELTIRMNEINFTAPSSVELKAIMQAA